MTKNSALKKLYIFLLGLIIFLIPTNIFWSIDRSIGFVNGLLIDYLIPKIYLVDFPVLFLIFLWDWGKFKQLKWPKIGGLTLVFGILLVTRQIFTTQTWSAVWFLLRMAEATLLALFLHQHKSLVRSKSIQYALAWTLLFQSVIGIFQYFTQSSIGGYLFLGEVDLSYAIGLAKDSWWQSGRVLPYGTTPHPNILGGTLVVYLLLIRSSLKKRKGWWLIVGLALTTLVLTQSISAILALIFASIYLVARKWEINKDPWLKASLLMFVLMPLALVWLNKKIPNNPSISRRVDLQNAAFNMILDKPLLGVGINQFASQVEFYSEEQEVIRFNQPVHHVGLLWWAETGFLGLIFASLLFSHFKYKLSTWLVLAPIFALDHYLLSLSTGLMLLALATVIERTSPKKN